MVLGIEVTFAEGTVRGCRENKTYWPLFLGVLGWEGAHTPYMNDQGMVSAFQIKSSAKPPALQGGGFRYHSSSSRTSQGRGEGDFVCLEMLKNKPPDEPSPLHTLPTPSPPSSHLSLSYSCPTRQKGSVWLWLSRLPLHLIAVFGMTPFTLSPFSFDLAFEH